MNRVSPNAASHGKRVYDRTDPLKIAAKIIFLVPSHVRESFTWGENLFADDKRRDVSVMRSHVWSVLAKGVDTKGRPFKPRAKDVDEVVDAMTAWARVNRGTLEVVLAAQNMGVAA